MHRLRNKTCVPHERAETVCRILAPLCGRVLDAGNTLSIATSGLLNSRNNSELNLIVGEIELIPRFFSEPILMPKATHSPDSKLAPGNIEQLSIR